VILVIAALNAAWLTGRWPEACGLLAAMVLPVEVSSLLAVAAVLASRPSALEPFEEVVFLQATAAELRSGHSLRRAMAAAAARAPGLELSTMTRSLEAGQPMAVVAAQIEEGLPDSGVLTAAAVEIAGAHGGSVAPVFSTLAALQSDAVELRREVESSTAAVRASVYVVAALPAAALLFAIVSGQVGRVLALGSVGLVMLGGGASLLAAGMIVALALARGVRP